MVGVAATLRSRARRYLTRGFLYGLLALAFVIWLEVGLTLEYLVHHHHAFDAASPFRAWLGAQVLIAGLLVVVVLVLRDAFKKVGGRTASAISGQEAFAQLWLRQTESALDQTSPADFETTQNAASVCIAWVRGLEDGGWWCAGYDSLDSFYAAHEARHPDIRVYAAVSHEIPIEDPNNPPNGIGEVIARHIALRRPSATI